MTGRTDVFLNQTKTSAFLVVHNGRLVEERYLLGHNRESLQSMESGFHARARDLARFGLLYLQGGGSRVVSSCRRRG